MRGNLIVWAVLASLTQDSTVGLVVERQVRAKILDPVNRLSEIHRQERVYVHPEKVRIEDATFGLILIIRLDQNKAYRLDRSLQTYSEVTFEQVSAARSGFLAEILRLKERVKGTPDESNLEKIERGFQAYPVTSSALSTTGRKERVLGAEMEETQLLVNAKIQIFKSFIDSAAPEGQTYFRALAALSSFGDQVRPEIEKVKGFPLRGTFRYSLFLDRVEVEEEVRSMRREPLSDDLFEVPKGWKRVRLPGVEPEASAPVPIPESLRK